MKHLYILINLCFGGICCCFAQVEGNVSNAKDSEVLPFTHVVNLTKVIGVYTDINGYYRIEAAQGDLLQFSYVGFVKRDILVGNISQINVKLEPDELTLSEIVIRPGVNPAHRMINNVIANRTRHNPENRNSYSCILYNKLIVDISADSVTHPEIYASLRKTVGDSHMLINETVIHHEYKFNGNVNEQILSSRTSGFNEFQQLAFLQPKLQFFHFYNDMLEWKAPVKFFLNPISPGSTSKYFFLLRDTIVSNVDTTFIISYQPRRSVNFEGLKGLLHISTNGWAIQKVVAEPADYSPVRLKIQQSYALLDSVWFPSELSLELFFTNMNKTGRDITFRGKSHITNVNLAPNLSDLNFKSRKITMANDAHLKSKLVEQYRSTELTAFEDSTYRKFDKKNFDYIFQIIEGFTDKNALSVKIFDFPFNKIFTQNYSEGLRVGLGMYTNRHLSPWFSVGGYYGYGINDGRSKYGASVSVFPEKHLDSEVKLWLQKELVNLALNHEAGISGRKFFGNFDITTKLVMQELQTTFVYSFLELDMLQRWTRNLEAGFKLRYAHREERIKMFKRTRPAFTTRPIVYLNVFYGIPGCSGSAYQYLKTEAGIERNWYIRNLGTATISLWSGWMSHSVPFPLAFTVTETEQSLFHSRNPDSRKRFNVLTGDVYASNQYLNAFLYHDFGTLLGKTRSKVFRPRIAVAQSFGWSKLNSIESHISSGINILDMRQGYFESGVIVEDVIRIEFFNMFFFGIGGGVYGAYGNSVQKPFEKTLMPKIRLTASF